MKYFKIRRIVRRKIYYVLYSCYMFICYISIYLAMIYTVSGKTHISANWIPRAYPNFYCDNNVRTLSHSVLIYQSSCKVVGGSFDSVMWQSFCLKCRLAFVLHTKIDIVDLKINELIYELSPVFLLEFKKSSSRVLLTTG